jgi:hypothetical protein
MADALTLGTTYSSVQGLARPLPPGCRRPPSSLVAALYSHPPIARPSLCPTPISHAATTSEGVDYSTGPGLYGAPASIMLPWPRWFLPIVPGAAFALPRPDALLTND